LLRGFRAIRACLGSATVFFLRFNMLFSLALRSHSVLLVPTRLLYEGSAAGAAALAKPEIEDCICPRSHINRCWLLLSGYENFAPNPLKPLDRAPHALLFSWLRFSVLSTSRSENARSAVTDTSIPRATPHRIGARKEKELQAAANRQLQPSKPSGSRAERKDNTGAAGGPMAQILKEKAGISQPHFRTKKGDPGLTKANRSKTAGLCPKPVAPSGGRVCRAAR